MRFEWTADLETGNGMIDEQHQGLFALANRLDSALQAGDSDPEIVADCVWALTDYVIEHFADEQELMADAGYPELSVHTSLHERLTGETMRITARFMNEEPLSAAELAPLITSWLRDHIGSADRRFVAFLSQHR